ncbi:MAG: hypothetical protein J4400_05345 [Candidatus Aenigmarchaeota archaeon]|nr:hypothetical protein [Candidatus Aenigmarchaeota archaeon]
MVRETPEIRRAVCYTCSGIAGATTETEQWIKYFGGVQLGEPYWNCRGCNFLLNGEGRRITLAGLPEYIRKQMSDEMPHTKAA